MKKAEIMLGLGKPQLITRSSTSFFLNAMTLFARRAFSSCSPGRATFSFPAQSNPSPHQVFHLPHGASQAEIKARYYELVRQHHPDSVVCRHLSAAQRHARFQAIRSAYDRLRKGTVLTDDDIWVEVARRKRAQQYQHARRAHYANHPANEAASFDIPLTRRDHIFMAVGLVLLGVGMTPLVFMTSLDASRRNSYDAAVNIAQARADARTLRQDRQRRLEKELSTTTGTQKGDVDSEP